MTNKFGNSEQSESISRNIPIVAEIGIQQNHAVVVSDRPAPNEHNYPKTEFLQGNITTPSYHAIDNLAQYHKVLYSSQGSALLIKDNELPIFISSGTAVILCPSEPWQILLGRGEHEWLLAYWDPEIAQVPLPINNVTTPIFALGCSPVVRDLSKRIIAGADNLGPFPNFTLAWINMLIHERGNENQHFHLTPMFNESLGAIQYLVDAIRNQPQKSWNLTEAAELAGYSPFHLSRLFKATANMGFPEFVDRCRAEIAINALISSQQSIILIAEQCGFGSPQALRNATREYTGFLPSELRIQTLND